MKQYMITQTITVSFECEAKNKKEALSQFKDDLDGMFDHTDCKFEDGERENFYVANENGEYVEDEG
jgi:hypothetical protein